MIDIEELRAAHKAVDFWPENNTTGIVDLLKLRNMVPGAIAEIERLRAAGVELLSGHDNLYVAHFGPASDPTADIAAQAMRDLVTNGDQATTPIAELCDDCPPVDYPTDKTRCLPCPRRAAVVNIHNHDGKES